MKYRKKPVEVEAVQFTNENKDQTFCWASSVQMNIYPSFDEENNPVLIVPTLEGEMVCSFGDYLIKEPFPTDWRKIHPYKPDIFEKTYEEVVKRWAESPISDSDEDNAKYYPDSLEVAAIKSAKNSKRPLLCFETKNTLNGSGD